MNQKFDTKLKKFSRVVGTVCLILLIVCAKLRSNTQPPKFVCCGNCGANQGYACATSDSIYPAYVEVPRPDGKRQKCTIDPPTCP